MTKEPFIILTRHVLMMQLIVLKGMHGGHHARAAWRCLASAEPEVAGDELEVSNWHIFLYLIVSIRSVLRLLVISLS
jgi:hypothetical protein